MNILLDNLERHGAAWEADKASQVDKLYKWLYKYFPCTRCNRTFQHVYSIGARGCWTESPKPPHRRVDCDHTIGDGGLMTGDGNVVKIPLFALDKFDYPIDPLYLHSILCHKTVDAEDGAATLYFPFNTQVYIEKHERLTDDNV